MKISSRKKVNGILFAAVVLFLVLSVLTPALGMKSKSISTTTDTYGYGYGYGYGSLPHSPGFWNTFPQNCGLFTVHSIVLPLCLLLHKLPFNH